MSKSKVELVTYMGHDINTPADVARVSFGKEASEFTPEQNTKLVKYLARNKHFTPFCSLQATVKMEMNLAIHAQLVKHRFGGTINTMSRRYVRDQLEFDTPDWRKKPKGSVKQGSGGQFKGVKRWLVNCLYLGLTKVALLVYWTLLKLSVAPEQARLVLPSGTITKCVVTGSIEYFARMYRQRTHEHAQRDWDPICERLDEIFTEIWPVSWKLLTRGEGNET